MDRTFFLMVLVITYFIYNFLIYIYVYSIVCMTRGIFFCDVQVRSDVLNFGFGITVYLFDSLKWHKVI